jgi:hypothetical protein
MKAGPKKRKKKKVRPKKKKKFIISDNFKKISFSIGIALFFIFLAGLSFCKLFGFLSQESVRYADDLIREEQNGYVSEINEILQDAELGVNDFDRHINSLRDNRILTTEEKKEVAKKLKELERVSTRLKHSFDKHSNDWSIQFYPRKSEEKISFVYKAKSFAIAIDHFVRVFEDSIFYVDWYREDQIILIKEDYAELLWFLREFGFESVDQDTSE